MHVDLTFRGSPEGLTCFGFLFQMKGLSNTLYSSDAYYFEKPLYKLSCDLKWCRRPNNSFSGKFERSMF